MFNETDSCGECADVMQTSSLILALSILQNELPNWTTVWLIKPFPNIFTFVPPWILPLVGDIELIAPIPVTWTLFGEIEFPSAF